MRKNYLILFFVILINAQFAFGSQDEEKKDEPYYQQLTRAIIRLESIDNKPVGTAFFVSHKKDNRYFYLVTARHVVYPPKPLKSRVPSQRKDTKETEIVELRIPADKWIFHPDNEKFLKIKGKKEKIAAVDVAVVKVPGIKDRRIRTTGYCPKECINPKQNQFFEGEPMPPLRVIVWGFPANLGFTLEEQRPLVRLGLLAMKAEEPFIRTDDVLRDAKVLLLDAPIFPGNSGGPIFTYPILGEPKLIGLISASNIQLNYAIAEPVSRIAEALDAALISDVKIENAWFLINGTLTNP